MSHQPACLEAAAGAAALHALCGVMLLAAAGGAAAQTTAEWLPTSDGRYDNPANWSTQTVPGLACCAAESALFDHDASLGVELPPASVVATLTPMDLLLQSGATQLHRPPGGATTDTTPLHIADHLLVGGDSQLLVGGGVEITAARTTVAGGGEADTELALAPGSSSDLGVLRIGGGAGDRDSVLTIAGGAEVAAGHTTINAAGAAGHTASLQATQGVFRQADGSTLTVGADAASGLAILSVSSGGEVYAGSGGLQVLPTGRLLNIGGAVHFGGDVTLAGGGLSYTETLGSGATRGFAPGSTVSIAAGAAATLDAAPLRLDAGQTLAIDASGALGSAGPGGAQLDAAGPIVLGADSTLALVFEAANLPTGAPVASGGAVTLAGTLEVSLLPGGPLIEAGDQLPLIAAAGGFSGAFDQIVTPELPGVAWQLSQTAGALVLTAVATAPGDYNGDGLVDGADYAAWRNTLGSDSQLAADGNGNGVVDAADLDVWRQNVSPALAAALAAVPEPATAVPLLGAAVWALGRRAKQRPNGRQSLAR
ncbi:MAG: dockerin type I domain-containing protein [Planctomycetota bacterium]